MHRRRFITIAAPTLLFVVTGVVALAVLGRSGGEPLGSALAVGVVSSLAATMLVSAAQVVVAVRTQPAVDPARPPGLVSVRRKSSLTSEDWLGLLRNAKTEFYIAGHSLGKWCSPTNRDEFLSHVTRILESDGHVTLVMLDAGSPQIARLQRATSIDYSARVMTSLQVLADLNARLRPPASRRLKIAALTDPATLPYMVVGNDRCLVTSTYLGSSDSDHVLCLELDRSSDAAAPVYDDFHALARSGLPPTLPTPTVGVELERRAPRFSIERWRRR
jgi:hypothetical protein